MPRYKRRTVDVKPVRPLLDELILRCGGITAAAEYTGLTKQTLHNIRRHHYDRVYPRTAGLIVAALRMKRLEDRNGHATHPDMTAARRRASKIDRAYE